MKSIPIVVLLLAAIAGPAVAVPEGTLTWGLHVTLAAKWLDPSDTEAFINPFMVLYAVHDALVKPMPAGDNTPSLAESWTVSKDGLTYEFVLRHGVKFHNGDPVTAEDVKFSFDRYRGAVDRAEEVRREGRRRRLPEIAGGRRALPRGELHPRRLARDGSVRELLAQDAVREAARVSQHHRRGDARRRPEGG